MAFVRPSSRERTPLPPQIDLFPFDPLDPRNADNVEQIIRWTVKESMVPISRDSILRHHLSTAAFANLGGGHYELAGYAAITQIYAQHIVELGGLVVNPDYRGHGVASKLARHMVKLAFESFESEAIEVDHVLAWSNPTSATLFARIGGTQIEDASTLPPEVWKLCHTCRYYDEKVVKLGQVCCGRVYDLTDVKSEGEDD